MQMTDSFASAVAVSIPIFALAAGAEARAVRDRLRETDERWEKRFAEYEAEHSIDPDDPGDVLRFLTGIPRFSLLRKVMMVGAAISWLIVFALLAIAELLCLLWLGDGAHPGDAGLATFALLAIGLALLSLVVTPVLYLLVPVLMPLDILPSGLKRSVATRLGPTKGKSFLRLLVSELEGAIDRAADKADKTEKESGDA
jgi:hypothetical protein